MGELISIKAKLKKNNNQYVLYWLHYFHRRVILSLLIISGITSLFIVAVLATPLFCKTEKILSYYEKVSIASIRFCILMTFCQTVLFYIWSVFSHRMIAYKYMCWLISLVFTSAFFAGLLLYLYAITGMSLTGLLTIVAMLFIAVIVGWGCNYYFNDFIAPFSNVIFYIRFLTLYCSYFLLQYLLDAYLLLPTYMAHLTSIQLWITTPTFVLCSILNSSRVFDLIQEKAFTKLNLDEKKQIFYGSCSFFCFCFTFFIPILLFQYFHFIFFDSRYLSHFLLMILLFIILLNVCTLSRIIKKRVND